MIHLDWTKNSSQFLLIPFRKESRAPASFFPPQVFCEQEAAFAWGLHINLLDIDSTAMLMNIPSSFVRHDHMCWRDICGRICLFFLVGGSLRCLRLCGIIHTTQIPGILRSKSKQHLDLVNHHFSIFDLYNVCYLFLFGFKFSFPYYCQGCFCKVSANIFNLATSIFNRLRWGSSIFLKRLFFSSKVFFCWGVCIQYFSLKVQD